MRNGALQRLLRLLFVKKFFLNVYSDGPYEVTTGDIRFRFNIKKVVPTEFLCESSSCTVLRINTTIGTSCVCLGELSTEEYTDGDEFLTIESWTICFVI
jgi:hypothetical protein